MIGWPLTLLGALCILACAALRGWREWLEVRRLEIQGQRLDAPVGSRIEIANLRERVRKLETIASGIDP